MAPAPQTDLVRRRGEIRHELARLNWVTVVALLISMGLALAAAFHAYDSRQANERTREQLWQAHRAGALALRLSGKVGRRQESLNAIAQAAGIRTAPELRDEAIAALALIDVRPDAFWLAVPPRITTVGCSADLSRYALGDARGTIQVGAVPERREGGTFSLPGRAVMSLDFSPDGRYLAARFLGGALRVWDLDRSKQVFELDSALSEFHEHSVTFHPGGNWLVVDSSDGPLHLIDTLHWVEVEPMPVFGGLAAHQFSHDGSQLAVAVDKRIEIWDFASRQLAQTIATSNKVTDLVWHPHGQILAGAHRDGSIALWDRRWGEPTVLRGHTMVVTRLCFDPQGRVLVSTSWDGTSRFWDAGSGEALLVCTEGYAVAFNTTGDRLFYFKEGLGIGIWRFAPATGFTPLAVPFGISDRILGVDIAPDGEWLTGTTGEGVHLWRRSTGEHLGFLPLPDSQRAVFQRDGLGLVCAAGTGLYRVPLGGDGSARRGFASEPVRLAGTEGGGYWLGFTTRGQADGGEWFTTASRAEVARVDLRDPSAVQRIPWPGPRRSAVSSPDGRFVATSAWKGGRTQVWDVNGRRQIADLPDDGGLAQFSADGRWLLVGASTEFVLYDTSQWKEARRLTRNVSSALSGIAAFSPDNRYLALTHSVRQVQLRTADGEQVLSNLDAPHPERVTSLCFSRDGNLLAAATDKRTIQLWDLAGLRRTLVSLNLDWDSSVPPRSLGSVAGLESGRHLSAPSRGERTVGIPVRGVPGRGALWFSCAGAGLALVFALFSVRQHRRLVEAYEAVDRVAEERRREIELTQSHLIHTQKMKALGTLAAGVAHDFNNLLSIILMSGQLVRRQVKPTGLVKENLDAIDRAVAQGRTIAGSILGYSRQPGKPDQLYSVNQAVSETLAMLNAQFLGGVVLTLELEPGDSVVRGDKNRLQQVLLNLIVNAQEAMGGSGKLTLSVRAPAELGACLLPPRVAKTYIELRVRDSGPGISPEMLPRIFEPFFTTKGSHGQHGTGLGLTTVYAIARQDGFGLAVESVPAHGATFRVIVPMNDMAEACDR